MIRVEKYGRRTFAVYEEDALLAVVCYRKGAEALRCRIAGLRQRVADLEERLRETATTTPTPRPAKGTAKRPGRQQPGRRATTPPAAPWSATA